MLPGTLRVLAALGMYGGSKQRRDKSINEQWLIFMFQSLCS